MDFSCDKILSFLLLLCGLVNGQICLEKYRRFPNHTMCLSWSHLRQDKNVEKEIVDKHNDIRANVIPAAANMLQMEYFKTLNIEAQIWAEQCAFTHDDFHLRFQPARYDVGQNILTSKMNLSWTQVIDQWLQENKTFIYGNPTNKQPDVGNYTQIVSAETRAVGCGSAYCNRTYFYVCNYSPRLNPALLSTPYERSMSNSSCDSCPQHCNTNGTSTLCSCEGKFCQNGGKLNLTTCECECVKGVNSYNASAYCELSCHPNGDHPSCNQHSETECLTNSTIDFMCPWKCGICPWGGSNYRRGSVPLPWECPKLGNITHGSVSYTGYSDGTVATYNCENNYFMTSGNKTRVCSNGKWLGEEPKCHTLEDIQQMLKTACRGTVSSSTSCPDPSPIPDGHISVNTYDSVKLAVYSCNNGHYPATGDTVRVCQNGVWTGKRTNCIAIPTSRPTNQVNGQGQGHGKSASRKGCDRNGATHVTASMFSFILVAVAYMYT